MARLYLNNVVLNLLNHQRLKGFRPFLEECSSKTPERQTNFSPDDSSKVLASHYTFNCKVIWENRVMRSKPSSNTKPWKKKKRAHSRHFARAKKLLSPQQESKGKKRRLNKKVSSAVFRAWTDKQREFYVCAKCNLTLQTSFIHWNILPPCTAQKKVAGIWTPTSVKQRSAMWFALRFISPRCFPARLSVEDSNFERQPTLSSTSKI